MAPGCSRRRAAVCGNECQRASVRRAPRERRRPNGGQMRRWCRRDATSGRRRSRSEDLERYDGWRGSRRRSARRREHRGLRGARLTVASTITRFSSTWCAAPARHADRATWRRGDDCAPRRDAQQHRIVAAWHRRALRPEGGELRVPQLEIGARSGEELGVLGVGSRPAALDEADAQRVEVAGDRQLVGDRQRHPLALGAVAQRRVVDVKSVGRHLSP